MCAELTFRVLPSQGLILFFDLVPTVLILLAQPIASQQVYITKTSKQKQRKAGVE